MINILKLAQKYKDSNSRQRRPVLLGVLELDAHYPQALGTLTLNCDLLVEFVYHIYQTCEHLEEPYR